MESRAGQVAGLGLLPVEITFAAGKTLGPPAGRALGEPVSGYEIHHGYVSARRTRLPPLIRYADGSGEGAVLRQRASARTGTAPSSPTGSAARSSPRWRAAGRADRLRRSPPTPASPPRRERTLDLLGDLVEEHLDTAALWRLIESGPPAGLPFIPPGAPPA